MTKAEIKINLNEILKFIKFAGNRIPTEHYSWDSEKHDWIEALNEAIKMVEQEPKTGHWIWCGGSHKCSNCEEYTCFSFKKPPRYCPNCGCRMVEPQESEDEG